MLNSNKTTVALGGKSECANKNNSQCYFPDDTDSMRNKCNGQNGRNFMPPRFMNALLLVILCVVLKNEYTYENEAELRTNASRQLCEMNGYSKGPRNNICTRNDGYDFPGEHFNNMHEVGMAPHGWDPRIQMSPHEEWNGERGPHDPRNRDMNMGMRRDMERGNRRRYRNRDDSDDEIERGNRRRYRNRDDSDDEMERGNRRRRVRGRHMDREDGGYMYENGRGIGRGRDRDEMSREGDRDRMSREGDRDRMSREGDRDRMSREGDRDRMSREGDRDEMERRRDRDEMGRRRDRDEMGRRRDRDEMGRRRDRDEMGRRRDRDEMGRGRGRERGKEKMDDENVEQQEMPVKLGWEVGRILPRGDMNIGMDRNKRKGKGRDTDEEEDKNKKRGKGRDTDEEEDRNKRKGKGRDTDEEEDRNKRKGKGKDTDEEEDRNKRKGKGKDTDEEEDRNKRRGKGKDMNEEEDKNKRKEKGKDMDMENGMNKKPNANKNMPPVSDIKALETSNTVDVNFHVTESDIAQMIDKLEDYVKVDDMFLLFNLVNNNEKNKYIKMQLGVIKLCEVLAQYYKTPQHYKTRQWAKSYQGMTEQLLHNERKSYNKLCTFLQNGNSSHVAFVEFLNELVGIWTSFTKEMEKYWKNYLSSKLKLYWETNNADM
ncbi:Uncharacterized protein PCOAH_00009970 [Plasmodium coatneyi]|uniref:Plasmodium RESA N-terminal domain-containing protein n=1 Tax=Plasmodium coatneyi TaxID=208452 RepID=A0A1B1DW79_9APIC|nr:Uncharacterized protein PCOAH_00009970 [Plasmodium coatneyi]ANQ06857.1 Uncharacterized protein PCOAH_00009970 [Plasmodium coatneyi]